MSVFTEDPEEKRQPYDLREVLSSAIPLPYDLREVLSSAIPLPYDLREVLSSAIPLLLRLLSHYIYLADL